MSLACSWDRKTHWSKVGYLHMCSVKILSHMQWKTTLANLRIQIARKIYRRNKELEAEQPESVTKIVIQDWPRSFQCSHWWAQTPQFILLTPDTVADTSRSWGGDVATGTTYHSEFCEGLITLYLHLMIQSLGELCPKERTQIMCYDIWCIAREAGKVIIWNVQFLQQG